MHSTTEHLEESWRTILTHLGSAEFYWQVGGVAVALAVAWALSALLVARSSAFSREPEPDAFHDARLRLYRARILVLPLMAVVLFGAAVPIAESALGGAWLLRIAQGVAVVFLLYRIADQFISNQAVVLFLKWVGIPIALLYVFGWLGDITGHLDEVTVEVGNISFSLYALLRTVLFGVILFWLGRASNVTGQRVIRTREFFDAGTREVVSKLFEIGIYTLIVLLLINVMGVDLTALAIFGGALGVGLGFGLQQIASNFISGLIILLDRSLTIGDYIELEDDRAGILRELTMRSATLETFDGKDIMVPNERFITTAFVNWTHNNKKQRYALRFQVAYKTDLDQLFELVRETVANHPRVLSGPDLPIAERPDAEIESFGESGINILAEFWMEGIDDGENRISGDLLLMIWTALKANGIEMPFPQREVKILAEAKGWRPPA